jgi:hypothetical protein
MKETENIEDDTRTIPLKTISVKIVLPLYMPASKIV